MVTKRVKFDFRFQIKLYKSVFKLGYKKDGPGRGHFSSSCARHTADCKIFQIV